MSYFLHVFCRSARNVTRRELADFIVEGVYFRDHPEFDPSREAESADDSHWSRFVVRYAPDKRPVIFTKALGDELRDEITDALSALDDARDQERADHATAQVEASRQVMTIEVERAELTPEAWFMLDSVEAFVARECDGIVFAEDDGFYDQKLQPIVKLH